MKLKLSLPHYKVCAKLIFSLGDRWGVSGQLRAPAVLPPERESTVPFFDKCLLIFQLKEDVTVLQYL